MGNPYSKIVVDPSGVNSIELGAYGVPETILINNNSKTILKKYIGPLDKKKLTTTKKTTAISLIFLTIFFYNA